jgi:hypothetical protein
MYAGQHPVRYSPNHGPGNQDQRRYQNGGYSQSGWDHGGHANDGYAQNGYPPQGGHNGYPPQGGHNGYPPQGGHYGYPPQGGYGQNYGNRHSPPPSYGTRTPSPQFTEHDESVRREHQDSRYNQLMNNSPAPTSSRRTPDSQFDNSSTIHSSDDDEWQGTTYTVSDEDPAAGVSCTNLLFGSGKKKAGLVNCSVDPNTTEMELNINMPRIKQLEKSVDQYIDRMAPSDANLKSALQAFHCKAEPNHNPQYAQYARYDYDPQYDERYDEPSYIREAYHQQQPRHRPSHQQVRRQMPSEVYESALFSQGSASTEESEEEEIVENTPPYTDTKHALREIIVEDNNDTVSVLSDKHLLRNTGTAPREYQRQPTSPLQHFKAKQGNGTPDAFSPTKRGSPLSPSARSKGFEDLNEKASSYQNVDENGLKKDSESSSLVALLPDEIPGNTDEMQETLTRIESRVNQTKEQHPSFDEPGEIPKVGKSRRKKAEILTDDDEVLDRRIAMRSPRHRMLAKRSEMAEDAPSASDTREEKQEKSWHKKPTSDELMGKSEKVVTDELMGKSKNDTFEDELMGKSRRDPEDELMGRSIKSQNVMAESKRTTSSTTANDYTASTVDNDLEERFKSSLETDIDDGLLGAEDIFSDPYAETEGFEEEVGFGEEVDYMPSTRAAAALIENMMGTLTKQPLRRINEETPNLEDLDFHSCDGTVSVSRSGKKVKDLYRFL